jgi:hypothetical protein
MLWTASPGNLPNSIARYTTHNHSDHTAQINLAANILGKPYMSAAIENVVIGQQTYTLKCLASIWPRSLKNANNWTRYASFIHFLFSGWNILLSIILPHIFWSPQWPLPRDFHIQFQYVPISSHMYIWLIGISVFSVLLLLRIRIYISWVIITSQQKVMCHIDLRKIVDLAISPGFLQSKNA